MSGFDLPLSVRASVIGISVGIPLAIGIGAGTLGYIFNPYSSGQPLKITGFEQVQQDRCRGIDTSKLSLQDQAQYRMIMQQAGCSP